MSGIAGVLGMRYDRSILERMIASIHHRGLDGRSYCWKQNACIGEVRLATIAPNSGVQIVHDETEKICIAFDGKIFNHHEIRADLERKGHVFKTQTDMEVVIHLYKEFGVDCASHLRGMFAFALLDGERLLLARDRCGIKPLYYAFLPKAKQFIFASEIKAILQCIEFTPKLDMQAFADFIVLGYPVGTETFFEGVKLLAAGHTMIISCDDHQIRIGEQKSYYVRDLIRNEKISLEEATDALDEVLRDAVESHLAADVDVGLALSGGLDSTILALLTHEYKTRSVFTFTVADHEKHPDMTQSRIVADMIGSEHVPVVMSFDDYLEAIPGCVAAEDQPISLYSVPFYYLCRKIAQRVKVCLLGDGADTLFGGNHEYLNKQSKLSEIRKRLPLLKRLSILPSDSVISMIDQLSSVTNFDDYLQCLFKMNLGNILERDLDPVDKCAMIASLEMRMPYLDDRVFDLVCQLPFRFLVRPDLGISKYILKRFCLERFGIELMDVVLRKKLGVPSAGFHFLKCFDKLCNEVLPDDYLIQHEFGYCFQRKRQLLVFELFLEIFMTHRGDSGAVGSMLDFLSVRAG